MKAHVLLLILWPAFISAQTFSKEEAARWELQSQRVSIIRDQWDVPHIYGKMDADVVFGLMYTQCEDDFERVERNYIGVMGRLAEIDGEDYLYEDLRQRLFIDTIQAIQLYGKSPEWLKKLMDSWADGMNYYLYKNPNIKPLLIKRFKPWMPLMFSEGSIGGDISSVSLSRLKSFYNNGKDMQDEGHHYQEPEWRGSNGIAIAPSHTKNGNALLLINPHTSYYFRTEVHMVSEEGLNAYGAVTWGQFFVYQGFNEHCGWMHTSSSNDVIDEYAEIIVPEKDQLFYRYDGALKRVRKEEVLLHYKKNGKTLSKKFDTYFTHHGPVAGKNENIWISVKMMNEPVKALSQSFMRTKANGYESFKETMQLKTNSSNNTVFADKSGTIAYWQGNFIPKRKAGLNTIGILDGTDPETEWQGLHELDEIIQFKNPVNGWLQNCNSTPYLATGNRNDLIGGFPEYMGSDRQNYRGVHAIELLRADSQYTIEKLNQLAYDGWLPPFDKLTPSLLEAAKTIANSDEPPHKKIKEAYVLFEQWDSRYAENSVATTLAIRWGDKLMRLCQSRIPKNKGMDDEGLIDFLITHSTDAEKMDLLLETMTELEKDFGTWMVPWGEINRFQRLTGKINEIFDDTKPSFAVPFASSFWGSLAAIDAYKATGTKKQYGNGGNSFVAIVEFGQKVKARTIVSGGHSSNPASVHFNNQASMFCKGQLKDIYYYEEDVAAKAVKTYHPGE